MVVLAILLAIVVIAAFLYFRKRAELSHEEKMRQMERDEKLWDE